MSTAASRQVSLFDFRQKEKRKRQSYPTVEAYLKDRVPSRRNLEIFDRREVMKIANFCNLHPDSVRTQLRQCGYEKTTTSNGIAKWVRKR